MVGMLGDLSDTRLIKLASYLAGSLVRVGGITCDWVTYTALPGSPEYELEVSGHAPTRRSQATSPPFLGGYWPTEPQNLTFTEFTSLVSFFDATGMKLMFDLNELRGRNCQLNNSVNHQPDWCGAGSWDTSNVQAFLQAVKDAGLYGNSNLVAFELGNELITHLDPTNNTADIDTLVTIVKDIWAGSPATPPVYAPSTDACSDPQQLEIMTNVTTIATGYTFHNYPGQNGSQIVAQLTNATWLRTGIMTGAAATQCVQHWQSGPASKGLELLVTETSASWSWQLPPPAQNAFLHGFYTLPAMGQLAETGVTFFGRWSFSEGSPFATVHLNTTGNQWDAAADFWLYLAFKRTVAGGVLAATGDEDTDALMYAYCAPGNNGSVTLTAVNVGLNPVTIDTSNLPLYPRLEYVFTAPGGDLSSTFPSLNGGAPLRANPDGSVPDMLPNYVAQAGSITLPPQSQGFFVLLNAGASACN